MPGFPFTVDPVLTGIILAYQNQELVADMVLPKLNPILPRQEFKWTSFDFGQMITVPNTKVGRKGEPDRIEFTGTPQTSSTEDYGLDVPIPSDDVKNAPAGYDPRSFAAQQAWELVQLDREVRVAGKVFNSATYGVANKVTLAGASQWSSATSTPIIDVENARAGMVADPNKMVIGRAAWSKLRTNPSILQSISISGTDKGMATKRAVADLLELEDIIIGQGWVNIAKPGQPVVRQRVWGKHAVLFRSSKLATSMSETPTFGWTAQYGGPVSGEIEEKKMGLRGGSLVRAGESVKELITAPDLGYYFENAVA